MNNKEAFEAWLYDPKMPFLGDEETRQAFWSAWQAAWEARGKLDKKVCKKILKKAIDANIASGAHYYDEGMVDAARKCIQAIEEQG